MRKTAMALSTARILALAIPLALAGTAWSEGISFDGEVSLPVKWSSGKFLPGRRYCLVARSWGADVTPATGPAARYTIMDLPSRKFVRTSIPYGAFYAKYGDRFGKGAVGQLVAYDGRVSSLVLDEMKGYRTVAKYFCQFDHAAGTFSEPFKLADMDAMRYCDSLAPDPTGAYYYYATYVRDSTNRRRDFTTLVLGRVRLEDGKIDWGLTLELPKRVRPLDVSRHFFSPDGSKLAFVEHNEKLYEKGTPAIPRQAAYVVDIGNKTVAAVPVPLSPYGSCFSRDGKFLLFGSNELGEIWRVDLATKKVDLKIQGPRLIDDFLATPSGDAFFLFHDTERVSPKTVQVREVGTLEVRASIPVEMFPSQTATPDGRYLLRITDTKIGFYRVPDRLDSASVAGASTNRIRLLEGIGLGRAYLEETGLDYDAPDARIGNSAETFAPVVVARDRDILAAGTRDDAVGNEYIVGATHPIVARLDPSGKARWSVDLKKADFPDSRAGAVAATPDGGCVVYVAAFPHHQLSPIVRLVKLDAAGRKVWDMNFRGSGGPGTPVADSLELLANGHVAVTGHIYLRKDERRAWTGEVDGNGVIVSDRTGD
jgi:hypothetical protein